MTAHSRVQIDRRGFLLLGAGSLASLVTPIGATPIDESDFRALMVALEELGSELPATSQRAQDAFIHRVAAQAIRVKQFPLPKMGALGKTGVEIGPLARTQPPDDVVHGIALVSYRMAPDAFLEPHNHPNYSVATVGVEGEALVTHYETVGTPPPFTSEKSFVVRRTAQRLLRKGEFTTLSPDRDNIHTFKAASRGARFIDLFSLHGNDVGFSYLGIQSEPTAPNDDQYEARWSGNRPTNA